MNYIQMFADGGKTSDQELIKGIQKILGVDDEQMEQLLQIGINKYGSLEGIGQALNQATQGLTQNSSPEEVQAAVASVFQTNAESQMFKCGGKLQQLVSKFGKGGNVDCGCGGIKVGQDGFKTSGSGTDIDSGFHTWDIEVTPQKDTIVRYSYPSYNGKAVLTPNGGTVKEWLNGDMFPTIYRDRTWVNRHPRRFLLPFSGEISNRKIMNARELAQNHIPSQQEGGVMLEQTPGHDVNTNLTRRQARDLGRVNGMQENNAQFNFAMANAKSALRNQGLRGKELRERAREMAAGISPTERSIVNVPTQLNVTAPVLSTPSAITAPDQITLPETQVILDQMLADTNKKLTRNLNKSTSSKKGVEVGDASVLGTTPQSNVKVLWGEMPLVSTMFPNQKTNEQIQQEKSGRKEVYTKNEATNTPNNKSKYISRFDINGNPILGWDRNTHQPAGDTTQGQKNVKSTTKNKNVVNAAQNNNSGIPEGWYPSGYRRNFVTNLTVPYVIRNAYDERSPFFVGPIQRDPIDGSIIMKRGGKVKDEIKLAKCGKKVKK